MLGFIPASVSLHLVRVAAYSLADIHFFGGLIVDDTLYTFFDEPNCPLIQTVEIIRCECFTQLY